MSLTAGTRLGVYEVTAQIGEGGMGHVYRATDTKLKRQVAIKILPPSLAGDADRLARFQREAEVLASLNHPHIATIHGLEESGGITALVMELVEGDDLAQRIARGAIPLDEALLIAKQIADALEAAHEQGIIHRDLKPANIKVREDGTVKVLDFGLAKALDPAGASSAHAMTSPTLSLHATQAGIILGTAAYMSPEQARGKTVDKRADIWAFGCVLFEMLTGQRAFPGEDVSDTLAAVLRGEPEWATLPTETPFLIRRLLHHCLTKDHRQRLADIRDARIEIDEAKAGPAADGRQAVTSARSVRRERLAWSAVVVLAIVAAVPTVRYLREAPPASPPETRVDIVTPATADPISLALSPDGRQIVFVASGDGASRLWLRSLAATTSHALAGTEGASYPFWSPDSRSVGFFADKTLKRIDLGGGAPQIVMASTSNGPRGGTWNADGVILVGQGSQALIRVPASGGQAVAATTLDRQSSHRFPFFLPDGRHFLFNARGATSDTTGIYLGALDSPDMHRLMAADTAGVYLPEGPGPAGAFRGGGWLLWGRGGALVAQRLDLERQALVGDPMTVADSVAFDIDTSAVSVSATGLVAYRTGGGSRRQLAWFDRAGKALGPLGTPDEDGGASGPSVSPDGHRVAVWRTVRGNTDIWLLDGTRTSRFTSDAAQDGFPTWSPDGSRIAFSSTRKGRRDLYQKSSSGAGAEELLLESAQDKFVSDWSADGRFILYSSRDAQTGRDLWVLPTIGDRTPWVFLKTSFDEEEGAFSPDGRWVAYQSNESGRVEVYIRPFAGAAASGAVATAAVGQWQVSTSGGRYPRWRPDGKELYYLGPNRQMMAAPITVTGATLTLGATVVLFPWPSFGSGSFDQVRQYDVARDGRFLLNTVLDDAAAPITLLQNWQPEAKK